MMYALALCLAALAAILIWLAAKKPEVLPDGWAKWIMLLGGGLAVGALALLKAAIGGKSADGGGGPASAPVLVEVPANPSKQDVQKLDAAVKATDAAIDKLRKDAETAAAAAVATPSDETHGAQDDKSDKTAPAQSGVAAPVSVSDPDLASFVSERESELHDKP